MAAILKVKWGIIVVSVIILFLIQLLDNNISGQGEINRWRQLQWKDFKGYAKPLSGWGATIYSTVYLEFDSIANKHNSYAGQLSGKSWVKKNSMDEYGLRHEQYHFNVTEFISRELNQKLEEVTDKVKAKSLLFQARKNLDSLQTLYDSETEHSLDEELQHFWEFRIDSMLASFESSPNYFTDQYSGAQVALPVDGELSESHNNEMVIRLLSAFRYGMGFYLLSAQYLDGTNVVEDSRIRSFYADSLIIHRFIRHDTDYQFKVEIIASDSALNDWWHDIWIADGLNIVGFKTDFYSEDTSSYYNKIASTLVKTFDLVDTKDYWNNALDEVDAETAIGKIIKFDGTSDEDECLIFQEFIQYSFLRPPYIDEQGDFVFPYDPIQHADSLIDKNIVIINGNMFSSEPTPENNVIYVPSQYLPNNRFDINFGYTLKQDTSEVCFRLFTQSGSFVPSKSN